MALFNVHVQLNTIMVVEAGDDEKAIEVAQNHWDDAVHDANTKPDVHVTGEVSSTLDLCDGWTEDCIPYGGDGCTSLKDIITPKSS